MIDIFSILVHWCASCVNSGNVIPGAAGVAGGAAGALGGLGGLPGGGGGAGAGDAGADDAEMDRLDPPPLMSRLLPPRGPTVGPLVEVGGPRTPDELIETLGALTGVEGIAAGLEEGEPVAKVIQDYAAEKLVEEGLKTGSEAAGEKLDQVLEAEPPPKPAEPDPIIGQTGYVANDDGTVTTLNPDGSSSTPNADGSVTTVNPGGSSTTSAPTATPATGSMSPGSSGPSDPDGS